MPTQARARADAFAVGKRTNADVSARSEAQTFEQGGHHQFDFVETICGTKDVEPQCAAHVTERANAQVLPYRKLREQLVDLEALCQPMLMGLGNACCRDIDSIQENAARVRSFLAVEQPEECAFARAIGANDGVESTGGQLERNSLDGMNAAIGFADIADLERQLSRLASARRPWATGQGAPDLQPLSRPGPHLRPRAPA